MRDIAKEKDLMESTACLTGKYKQILAKRLLTATHSQPTCGHKRNFLVEHHDIARLMSFSHCRGIYLLAGHEIVILIAYRVEVLAGFRIDQPRHHSLHVYSQCFKRRRGR